MLIVPSVAPQWLTVIFGAFPPTRVDHQEIGAALVESALPFSDENKARNKSLPKVQVVIGFAFPDAGSIAPECVRITQAPYFSVME